MDYLRKEYGKQREGFLPLEFELGAYAEVDWTEAYFYLVARKPRHIYLNYHLNHTDLVGQPLSAGHSVIQYRKQ
jgi:hypothetical protein